MSNRRSKSFVQPKLPKTKDRIKKKVAVATFIYLACAITVGTIFFPFWMSVLEAHPFYRFKRHFGLLIVVHAETRSLQYTRKVACTAAADNFIPVIGCTAFCRWMSAKCHLYTNLEHMGYGMVAAITAFSLLNVIASLLVGKRSTSLLKGAIVCVVLANILLGGMLGGYFSIARSSFMSVNDAGDYPTPKLFVCFYANFFAMLLSLGTLPLLATMLKDSMKMDRANSEMSEQTDLFQTEENP